MNIRSLTEAESRLADLLWQHCPLPSAQVVQLCEKEWAWKKSTTYTMLRKLEQKQVFQNKNGTVEPLLTREEFYVLQSKQVVDKAFQGSLPRFLAAFTRQADLSPQEVEELQKLIDGYKEE